MEFRFNQNHYTIIVLNTLKNKMKCLYFNNSLEYANQIILIHFHINMTLFLGRKIFENINDALEQYKEIDPKHSRIFLYVRSYFNFC